MADLTEFYPDKVQPSPNGAGKPAAPGAAGVVGRRALGASVSASAGLEGGGSAVFGALVLVGLSLLLLHLVD
jgi:hypothetical protein